VVLPTRGEGYNLPAAEALAAGVPLIVTAHGGHCDFCGPEEARLIDYAFAVSQSHLASAGSVSVDPDVADLASALAEHVKRPDQARERAQRGAARILAETAPAALVARLTDIALDLLLAPPPVPLRIAWVSTWDVRCGIAEYSRHLLNHLPGDGLAEIVVLADTRSVEREGVSERRVRPVWRIGDPAGVGALAAALTRADPHAIVLQHQPGLIPWELLARFLNDAVRAERVVVAVLHNTRDLLRAGEADRLAAVEALGRISRVLVHTVADLNLLKGLGLTANVTMLLHGIEVPLPPSPARVLARSEPVLIGSYGFLLPGKGLPQLIEAMTLLRRNWPMARLCLVNARYDAPDSDAEITACRSAAAAAGLGDAVEFITDFLPDDRSLELLRECDLLVLPYQASLEASSAALRTALTAGVAVAVTPLPLFDEAEDAVFRLDGMDPAAIATGLDALLAHPAARDAVVRAAQVWTGEREWSSIGRRLAGMLRGLVAEKTG
jgi:glycosyltransferase involved in cell wall biosynthesis